MSSFIMPQIHHNINKSNITGFAEYDRFSVMEMAEKTILDILVKREQMLNNAKEEESRLIANHREDMKKDGLIVGLVVTENLATKKYIMIFILVGRLGVRNMNGMNWKQKGIVIKILKKPEKF